MTIGIIKANICINTVVFEDMKTAQNFLLQGVFGDADAVADTLDLYGIGDEYINGEWHKSLSPTPDINVEQILQNKLNEIKTACNETIYSGIDVETSQGKKHFSLLDHDQMELLAQKGELEKALAGLPSAINTSTGVPYHADGELCRFWSVEDFWLIADTAVNHIFYNRTYCNHLLVWAKRAEPDELDGIHYGSELPPDLAENIFLLLQMAGGEQS